MKLKRLIIPVLAAVLLLVGLSQTASADNDMGNQFLRVGETQIVTEGVLNQNISYPSGVSYDEGSNTLTLNGADVGYISATGSVTVHVTGDSVLGISSEGHSLRQIGMMSETNAQMDLRIEPGVTLTLQGNVSTESTSTFNPSGKIVLSGGGMLVVEGSNNDDVVNEHGILRMDGWTTICGAVSLPGDLTIAEGEIMFIDNGEVLTVGDGVTLTVNDLLTNNGTIALQGTGKVVANGIVADNGTVTVDGIPHAHNYSGRIIYTQDYGDVHGKRTFCADCPIDASVTRGEDCSGGTATCKDPAVCEFCLDGYGAADPNNHASTETYYESIDYAQHARKRSCCRETLSTGAHTIVDGTCTVCETNFNVVITHGTATYGYDSFRTALIDATELDGCTVSLHRYSEVRANGYTVEEGDFTIDLNGCGITSNDNDTFTVKQGAKLTITDSSADGTGYISSTKRYEYALMISGGEVCIQGGHIKQPYSTDLYSAYLDHGKLCLAGGTIDGIVVNQSSSELYISGDTPNSPQTCWINIIQRNIVDWLPRVQISQALTGDDIYTFRDEMAGCVIAGGIGGYTLTEADAARFAHGDNSLVVALNAGDNTICMKGDLATGSVTPTPDTLTYDGNAHTPAVGVRHNAQTLIEHTDYTVSYKENINAGTATVTVTGKGNYVGTKTATFTINKGAAPAIQFPTVKNNITYGQRLQDAELTFYQNSYGTFRWADPTGVPNAGIGDYALDFYPSDLALQNYDWKDVGTHQWIENRKALCAMGRVTVEKANMERTDPVPKDLTYTGQPQTLAREGSWENRVFSGQFHYATEENGTYTAAMPEVTAAGEYTLWYKPDNADSRNYLDVGPWHVQVTVKKAVPDYIAPTDLTVTKGQTLASVSLPAGWAWEDDTVSAGTVGAQTYKAVFTPTDTDNYNTVSTELSVLVCPDLSSLDQLTVDTVNESQKEELQALLTEIQTASEAELSQEKAQQLAAAQQKLQELLTCLPPYKLTVGDGNSWVKDSALDLTFTANGHFSRFTGIKVDGKMLDGANYTAVSGSTVVTLKAGYLQTLSKGTHTIEVCYNNGSAVGSFQVLRTGGSPNTADPAQPMLYLSLLTLSAAALYLSLRKRITQ